MLRVAWGKGISFVYFILGVRCVLFSLTPELGVEGGSSVRLGVIRPSSSDSQDAGFGAQGVTATDCVEQRRFGAGSLDWGVY